MSDAPAFRDLAAAAAGGDHETVIRLAGRTLAERPGNDAAYELRSRALRAAGRLEDARADAAAAVRLDPDEIRYRELLAEILSALGAHREAAEEYARLARANPRQGAWIRAEASERLAAADPQGAQEAARRALRLDGDDAGAQLMLAHALLREGVAGPALDAAQRAVALAPDDPDARETLADALWLAGDGSGALVAYAALARDTTGERSDQAVDRARALYRSRAGLGGRLLAAVRPIFAASLRAGRLRL
jgi:tetratricopeptide (TPR) repeat protein